MKIGATNFVTEQILDTPMRMLIRKYPELAGLVLDRCYKEKEVDQKPCVEMNFEFIEDSFNYQQKPSGDTNWMNRFMSGNSTGYEHYTKTYQYKSRDVFEKPYSSDHELIIRNHPMMVMVEHSRRV